MVKVKERSRHGVPVVRGHVMTSWRWTLLADYRNHYLRIQRGNQWTVAEARAFKKWMDTAWDGLYFAADLGGPKLKGAVRGS